MNAEKLLNINGNFKKSPIIESIQRIHKLFSSNGLSYVIVGGMSVIRNGAFRTTRDIDILTTHKNWNKILEQKPKNYKLSIDSAVDTLNSITIDILFSGDDWDMVFPLPIPEKVMDYDKELKAYFLDLFNIIQLKTAIYIQKLEENGIEIAAKDLADVVELIKNNKNRINEKFIINLHSGIRNEFRKIWKNIIK